LKTFIVLFICAVIHAINLKLVPGMSVPTFILTLQSFSGRKASAQTINSDNARTINTQRSFFKIFILAHRFKTFYSANASTGIIPPTRSMVGLMVGKEGAVLLNKS